MKEGQGRQLTFGELPSEVVVELERERRKKAKPIENLGVYDVSRMVPFVKVAVLEDARRRRESRPERRASKEKVTREVWGDWKENITLPTYFSPSSIANCLRSAGYEILGEELGYKPAPRTFEAEMALIIGRGSHRSLSWALNSYGISEHTLLHDEADISGRTDLMIKNEVTDKWQIVDFKFPGDWGFGQIKREGLPDYLRETKDIYNPSHEDRLQLLIYMWLARQRNYDVTMGNIIYINRNNRETKECLVPWNAIAEDDLKYFFQELAKADEKVQKKELPDPTVVSDHVCKYFCRYSHYCDHGQKIVAGAIKTRRKRRSRGVWKMVRRQEEERKLRLIDLGVVQPELPLITPDEEVVESTLSKDICNTQIALVFPEAGVAEKVAHEEEKKPEKKLYYLGQIIELEDKSCPRFGCGRKMVQVVVVDKKISKTKSQLLIEEYCPSCGDPHTKRKTVPNEQIVG